MTFDDDIFGHLDDPTPPRYDPARLNSVVARGTAIKQRRRTMYTMTSAIAAIVITGSAIAVAGASNHDAGDNVQVAQSNTPTPRVTGSPKQTRHHRGDGKKNSGSGHDTANPSSGSRGGTTVGGTGGGHNASGPSGGNKGGPKGGKGGGKGTGGGTGGGEVCTTPTPTETPTPDPTDTTTPAPPGNPGGTPTCSPGPSSSPSDGGLGGIL